MSAPKAVGSPAPLKASPSDEGGISVPTVRGQGTKVSRVSSPATPVEVRIQLYPHNRVEMAQRNDLLNAHRRELLDRINEERSCAR